MADNIQSIIERVKRLLALSKNNLNIHEMTAAALAADKIMQAHRLSLAEVEAAGNSNAEPFTTSTIFSSGKRSAWREVVLWALATQYGAAWYFEPVDRANGFNQCKYVVIARESDGQIIDYMFNYLTGEVERLCDAHCVKQGLGAALSWKLGCAEGIARQFDDMRQAERQEAEAFAAMGTATSSAMVLLSKRGDEANAHMKSIVKLSKRKAPSLTGGRDYNARNEGFVVGKTVSLNKGMTGGASKTLRA